MVSPWKMPSLSLLPLVRRKIFGSVRRLAAERLLPGEGDDVELSPIERLREARRRGVANREARAVGGDPIAVRYAHAGSGAVPGEHHVALGIDLGEIGKLAVIGLEHRRVFDLELLDDIGDPAFAERFPRKHRDRTRAEQRPQRHLHRAGIGRRHDADAVIGGDFEHLAGEIDGALELGLADLGTVRASERSVGKDGEAPVGTLGAGTG